MNKSDDPAAPKNQRIETAPHGGRNADGDIVADSTESSGQGGAWESSGDLPDSASPRVSSATEAGYSSGPADFEDAKQEQDPAA
ncbi:MAG: hypothetical protein H7Z41_00160 [Cytophagales bacterium]|nr:hypothetical protein [Armatimonadota bacterium]